MSEPRPFIPRTGPGERRRPHLASAIVGNGSVLATLSRKGEIERLFWPHVDWGQHLGEIRLGMAFEDETLWLDEAPFEHEQRYLEDTSALLTTASQAGLKIETLDFVHPEGPVLVRRVSCPRPGARLVVYCRPLFEESLRYSGAYVDPVSGVLVFYRRDRSLAVGIAPSFQAVVGRPAPDGQGPVWSDSQDGRLEGGVVELGPVDGALASPIHGEGTVAFAFGESPDEAVERVRAALAKGPEALLAERRSADAERLDLAGEPQTVSPGARELYRRSILTFDMLADRETGGIIAAPEQDSDFERSGGYGFVWGRDLAFISLALLAGGRTDLAEAALRWLARHQEPDGLWLQRHWTEGHLAPSWGLHQVDETGAILFAFEAAWRQLGDPVLDSHLWPAARRAAEFLLTFLDPRTGLPRPSIDLWEERAGEHAYSAASVSAGLRASGHMAKRHEPAMAGRYFDAARAVARSIEEHLWSEEHGRYLRSLWLGRRDVGGPLAVPDHLAGDLRHPNPALQSFEPADSRVDISLLGLAWPFGVVDPRSPRMRETVRAIERTIVYPNAGALRYEGDVYAGGNPWVLSTLWLGLYYRSIGDMEGWRRCVDFAIRSRTRSGLLPEQVTREGQTAWVVPLTWSHAMFVLAVRPELDAASWDGPE